MNSSSTIQNFKALRGRLQELSSHPLIEACVTGADQRVRLQRSIDQYGRTLGALMLVQGSIKMFIAPDELRQVCYDAVHHAALDVDDLSGDKTPCGDWCDDYRSDQIEAAMEWYASSVTDLHAAASQDPTLTQSDATLLSALIFKKVIYDKLRHGPAHMAHVHIHYLLDYIVPMPAFHQGLHIHTNKNPEQVRGLSEFMATGAGNPA